MGEGEHTPDELRAAEGLDAEGGIPQQEFLSWMEEHIFSSEAPAAAEPKPLEKLDFTVREEIYKNWAEYEDLSDGDKERLLAVSADATGEKLHQLRLLAEEMERTSSRIEAAATKLADEKLTGEQFTVELSSVLQQQRGIHQRLETLVG